MDIDHSADTQGFAEESLLELTLRHAISVSLDYVIVFLKAVSL